MSRRRWTAWLLAVALYGAFWWWYTPLGGPLTAAEVERFASLMAAQGVDGERLQRLRQFMAEDTGDSLVMVNLLDLAPELPPLPAIGPDGDAADAMSHYMAHMYPELLRRACHPLFMGAAIFRSMDLVGIEGAEIWTAAALVRYRSRRDLLEIATHPRFAERHEYKIAALAKTIAVPVAPALNPADPRVLLALVLLVIAGAVDRVLAHRLQTSLLPSGRSARPRASNRTGGPR